MDADEDNQATEDDAQGITFEDPTTAADEADDANLAQTEDPVVGDEQIAEEKEEEQEIQPIHQQSNSMVDDLVAEDPMVEESLPEATTVEEPVEVGTDQEVTAIKSVVEGVNGAEPVTDAEEPNQEEAGSVEAETVEPGIVEPETVEAEIVEVGTMEEGTVEAGPEVINEGSAGEEIMQNEIAETGEGQEAEEEEAVGETVGPVDLKEEPAAEETAEQPALEQPASDDQTLGEQLTEATPTEETPVEEAQLEAEDGVTEDSPAEGIPGEGDIIVEEESTTAEGPVQAEDMEELEQEALKIGSLDGDVTKDEEAAAALIAVEAAEGGEEQEVAAADGDVGEQSEQYMAGPKEEEDEAKEMEQQDEDGGDHASKKAKAATFNAPETKAELHEEGHRGSDTLSVESQRKPGVANKKYTKTFPYRGDDLDENRIQRQLKTPAPQHEYFGLIFSAESKRPPAYYHNYFLPFQKQPPPNHHIKVVGKHIPLQVGKDSLITTNALPLSTVKIRWMLNRRHTIYKASDLYAYLSSRFGVIENIYQVSSNSAIVVFAELSAAYAAIKAPGLGYPWDPLIADWWEPKLNNYAYLRKYLSIEDTSVHDLKIFDVPPMPK